MIEQRQDAVLLHIRVQPRASTTEVVGEHDGALKVRVTASPVDGAANAELVRYIAKSLGVARSHVRILTGLAGRTKVIEVDGVEASAVRRALLGSASGRP